MRGIHEEHLALSKPCFFKPWKHFTGVKIKLELVVALAGNGGGFAEFQTEVFHETTRLALAQADAGEFVDALDCLLGIRNGEGAKRALETCEKGVK